MIRDAQAKNMSLVVRFRRQNSSIGVVPERLGRLALSKYLVNLTDQTIPRWSLEKLDQSDIWGIFGFRV